ncbi:MAG: EAL domain-containing protein, partial [Rhizomicrobium sp.]
MSTRLQATALQAKDEAAPGAAASTPGSPTPDSPVAFTPVAYMVGHRADDVRALAAIMETSGFEHTEFENCAALLRGWSKRIPDMTILEVAGGGVDAVDTIFMLAEHRYTGMLLLTGERGNAGIEGIARVAHRHGLKALPAVTKPFDKDSLAKIFTDQKTSALQSGPSKIRLDEALKHNWIDFWYQPKIDLRSRNLIGVESFVRLFHPQIGSVSPSVFLQDANETSLFILGQRALVHAVKTASQLTDMGLNLRVAINVSVKVLRTLPVSRLIQTNHPD